MENNNMSYLKSVLFEQIAELKSAGDDSQDRKLKMEKAKAINDISKSIIECAKVEVQAMDIMSRGKSPEVATSLAIEAGMLKPANPFPPRNCGTCGYSTPTGLEVDEQGNLVKVKCRFYPDSFKGAKDYACVKYEAKV